MSRLSTIDHKQLTVFLDKFAAEHHFFNAPLILKTKLSHTANQFFAKLILLGYGIIIYNNHPSQSQTTLAYLKRVLV